jgi:hypothetical protein
MPYPRAEVEAAIRGLAEAFKEAERTNKWAWIADKFYHRDCVYTCPYAGAMPVVARSRDEIRATHYGRDMDVGSGWAGWSFPILNWAIEGDQIISHWVNRGPGRRPDGSYTRPTAPSLPMAVAVRFLAMISLTSRTRCIWCDEPDAAATR